MTAGTLLATHMLQQSTGMPQSGWTKDNMDAGIYIIDNGGTTARFATWNGVTGTNGGSRYIATGQAFWVKASGAGTPVLNADENVKVPGIQTTFFREQAPVKPAAHCYGKRRCDR